MDRSLREAERSGDYERWLVEAVRAEGVDVALAHWHLGERPDCWIPIAECGNVHLLQQATWKSYADGVHQFELYVKMFGDVETSYFYQDNRLVKENLIGPFCVWPGNLLKLNYTVSVT